MQNDIPYHVIREMDVLQWQSHDTTVKLEKAISYLTINFKPDDFTMAIYRQLCTRMILCYWHAFQNYIQGVKR